MPTRGRFPGPVFSVIHACRYQNGDFMKSLQSLKAEDLTNAFKTSRTLEFSVPESALDFAKSVPHLDFATPTEIPPSPVVLTPELIARSLLSSSFTLANLLASIILTVYWSGGKILYRRVSSDEYVAFVQWPPTKTEKPSG
jgi:hypothetical protein